jgi:hypothetical protein
MLAEWDYILPGKLEADVEQRDDGRVVVIPREKGATFLDAGPIYRLTFIEEDGNLRLEHFPGRF